MQYEEFKNNIIEELRSFYGSDAAVEVITSEKNNGIKLEGIIIRVGEANVSPVIYLQQYYNEYIENYDSSIDEVVEKIVELRDKTHLSNISGLIAQITDWDYVKDRLYPMVISSVENEAWLSRMVSRPFLDLSIILYVRLDDMEQIGGDATVKVTRQMLDSLGVTEEKAFAEAFDSLKSDSYSIQDIFSTIGEMLGEDNAISLQDDSNRLFVMTNGRKQFGASGILYGDYISRVMGSTSCYIIPSSVHEILLVPEAEDVDATMLKQMVEEVNETTVSAEEKLSDSVYFFNAETRLVSIAA